MAVVLKLSKAEGKYYTSLFEKVAAGLQEITPDDAVVFLRKSNISDHVLHNVWDLADHQSRGALNRDDFFRALKLIALVQNGVNIAEKPFAEENLVKISPLPRFEDVLALQLLKDCVVEAPPAETSDISCTMTVESIVRTLIGFTTHFHVRFNVSFVTFCIM